MNPQDAPITNRTQTQSQAQRALELGRILSEKCEFSSAKQCLLEALEKGQELQNGEIVTEAIAGLLRLAAEAASPEEIRQWEEALNKCLATASKDSAVLAWNGKGVVESYRKRYKEAQECFRHAMSFFSDSTTPQLVTRVWSNLAANDIEQSRLKRASWIAEGLVKRFSDDELGVMGPVLMLRGLIAEQQGHYTESYQHYEKAHEVYLKEHNWFGYLYVLFGYARIARLQRRYSQAKWTLNILEKAAAGSGFKNFLAAISKEKSYLEREAIDLIIDRKKGVVTTREKNDIRFGKQYVLLDLLKVLAEAHRADIKRRERGLTKAEIIEKVWNEKYVPGEHDNKLYYNINRLRKILEPNVKRPKYLLNSKQGYRLAPNLRVYDRNEF